MKHLAFWLFLIVLGFFWFTAPVLVYAQAPDTPTPTDTPTPSVTPTASETYTPTPDIYEYYDLGSGKTGELVYTATAGEVALISIGMVLVVCLFYIILLEGKRR